MIYAQISVFQIYSAFITASSKIEFIKLFTDIVKDSVEQYENYFSCSIGQVKDKIYNDMDLLTKKDPVEIENLFYDMKIDGCDWRGFVQVSDVYYNEQDVLKEYQAWVDELNEGLNPDEKWDVFGHGFFPDKPGYLIDYLFK